MTKPTNAVEVVDLSMSSLAGGLAIVSALVLLLPSEESGRSGSYNQGTLKDDVLTISIVALYGLYHNHRMGIDRGVYYDCENLPVEVRDYY